MFRFFLLLLRLFCLRSVDGGGSNSSNLHYRIIGGEPVSKAYHAPFLAAAFFFTDK